MKTKFYALALVLGLTPLYVASQQQTDRDRDDRSVQTQRDRDDNRGGSTDRAQNLQNTLRQRYPNDNISVSMQNNSFLINGNAASEQDRRAIDQWVRSYAGRNVNVINQLTVNGAGAYPNGYPTGVYPNGTNGYPTSTYPNGTAYPNNNPNNYPNNNGDRDRDRDGANAQPRGDRDRDDADRDRNRMPQNDVDARNGHEKDVDARSGHDKNKDKKNKHKDRDAKDREKDKKDDKKDKDKDNDNVRDNQSN